jgi:hypothetical protein
VKIFISGPDSLPSRETGVDYGKAGSIKIYLSD